ncbi:MAG: 4-hydroxythreonine-4-phosphate dehydrogenase PdxA [Burkholderiaceae bacterium]|nr:4-hydroxythreonine-4-phosphate dehydrogenase PdxA [Burkholderiaceae bacterium]
MIAVTVGDVCGIGPEIVLKAMSEPAIARRCIVVGDRGAVAAQARHLGLPMPGRFESVAALEAPYPPFGVLDARAGEAAYQFIRRAAAMAMAGKVGAVVTAPISKEAMHRAGHLYPGHTELLATLAGDVDVRMMLANEELRVILVTIHEALGSAIGRIKRDLVLRTIEIAASGLERMGIAAPRIAVAGLNPHAGEGGLFGNEEIAEIAPAVAAARAAGINASGPYPPDTVFMQARGFKRFDAVVAMYHDQGLIPVKYMGLDEGRNITLGLPFLRTSPDHGTAFDIAGKGIADPASMVSALNYAATMLDHARDAP